MKKTRFLSLLLAAALTASSLPMVVTADEADQPANLLDGATYTAATGSTVTPATVNNPDGSTEWGNSFLSIADRVYGTGYGFDINFKVTEDAAGKELFYRFNLRQAQPISDISGSGSYRYSTIRTQVAVDGTNINTPGGSNVFGTHGASGWYAGQWAIIGEQSIGSFAKDSSCAVKIIKGSGNQYYHDIDIDNVQIYYKDTDGTPVHLVNVTENFFSAKDKSDTCNAVVPSSLARSFEDIEEVYTIAYSDKTTNTTFTIKTEEPIAPGFYTLGGEFRLGDFTAVAADGTYTGHNDAILTIKVGDDVITDDMKVDTTWDEYSFDEFVVTAETDTITVIVDADNSNVADDQRINFRNLTLEYLRGFDYTVKAEEENLLDGVDAALAEGVAAIENVNGTGSLYIPERNLNGATGQDTDYVSFMIPRTLVGGTKYFVSFDICYHTGTITSGFVVRPKVNCFIDERNPGVAYVGGVSDSFILPVEGKNELTNTPEYNAKDQMFPQYRPKLDELQHFEGYFTPTADQKSLIITFQRGQNATNHNNPLTVDNLKVWSADGVVYSTDFNVPATEDGTSYFTYDGMTISSKVTPELRDVKIEHTAVTPFDTAEADVVYDTSKLSVKKGIYTFTTNVAATAAGAKAKLIVNVEGQEPIETELVEIPVTDTEYAELSISFETEHGAKITSIVIDTDLAGATLKLSGTKLTYSANEDGSSIPNIGIIMVLLKKKSGSDAQPKPKLNRNLIKEGKFKEAPEVVKEGYDSAKVAWYANAAMGYQYVDGAALKDEPMIYHDHNITWDDDGYVVVSGRQANIGRVWYNPGLVLEPGVYEINVDLKAVNVNETVVRFTAGDLDDKAIAPATLAPINAKWKTFVNKFTVTEPTPLRIAFFGGTGAGHKHDFAVDNLFLYMVDYYDPNAVTENPTVEVPSIVKPVEDNPADVKPAVAGNLIANGDLAAAPEVIKEGYDSTKAAWYANAAMSYAYDKDGVALKDEPKVYHDQNITWNKLGYVTVTGRLANIGRVWYNHATILEPGTYVLSVDLRTANVGESSVVRITAGNQDDKAFGAPTSAGINNTWTTFTHEFTIEDAQSVRIAFFGGTGAGHKHDFCIDNVVLIKK